MTKHPSLVFPSIPKRNLNPKNPVTNPDLFAIEYCIAVLACAAYRLRCWFCWSLADHHSIERCVQSNSSSNQIQQQVHGMRSDKTSKTIQQQMQTDPTTDASRSRNNRVVLEIRVGVSFYFWCAFEWLLEGCLVELLRDLQFMKWWTNVNIHSNLHFLHLLYASI